TPRHGIPLVDPVEELREPIAWCLAIVVRRRIIRRQPVLSVIVSIVVRCHQWPPVVTSTALPVCAYRACVPSVGWLLWLEPEAGRDLRAETIEPRRRWFLLVDREQPRQPPLRVGHLLPRFVTLDPEHRPGQWYPPDRVLVPELHRYLQEFPADSLRAL